jgi:hypothetical protein
VSKTGPDFTIQTPVEPTGLSTVLEAAMDQTAIQKD